MHTCLSVSLWVYVSVRYKKSSTWLVYSGILHLWNKFSNGRCSLAFHLAWLGSEALRSAHLHPLLLGLHTRIAIPALMWGSTLRSSGLYIKHYPPSQTSKCTCFYQLHNLSFVLWHFSPQTEHVVLFCCLRGLYFTHFCLFCKAFDSEQRECTWEHTAW